MRTTWLYLGLATLALAPSCAALQIRPPGEDLVDTTPVRPASRPSHLAAVLRLSHVQSGRLAESRFPEQVGGAEQFGPLAAKWTVRRTGSLAVSADPRPRLCFDAPFAGKGALHAAGGSLDHELQARLRVCARPALDGQGVIRLADPDAQVTIQRETVGGPVAALKDAVARKLQDIAAREVTQKLTTLSVPVQGILAPIEALLARPIRVGQDACLKLRGQQLEVAQPQIDPSALRFGAALVALPTFERPCIEAAPTTRPSPLAIVVAPRLSSSETVLELPVGLGVDTLTPMAQSAVDQLGKIETAQGWLQVGKIALTTAMGRLVVRAQVRGEVRDTVLFVPIRRNVVGEVLLWGTPQLQGDFIVLPDLELRMVSDDKLVELAAALEHSALVANLRKRLRLPRAKFDAEARKALDGVAQHIALGNEKLPVTVETSELTLAEVSAAGQRLEVLVRFRGQVIIGDRAAQ